MPHRPWRLSTFLCAMLLLLLCQSFAFADQTTPATQSGSADTAQSAITMFPDVPQNHWAYQAVQQLQQDGFIKGYPDGQFKGQRPMTRYEVAYLVAQAVDNLKDGAVQGHRAEQADIDALKALLAEFGNEVKDVQSRVAKLEKRTDDLEKKTAAVQAQADATQLRVNQGKIGFRFYDRPGTIASNVSVVNGPTTIAAVAGAHGAIAPNQAFPSYYVSSAANALAAAQGQNYGNSFTWGNGTTNSTPAGLVAHGTNNTLANVYYSGQITQRFSYGARMTAQIKTDAGNGTSSASTAYCTTVTGVATTSAGCSYTDLSGTSANVPVQMDYAYIGYSSPGGLYTNIGRFGLNAGIYNVDPIRFSGGSVTGVTVGINDPNKRYSGWLAYVLPPVSAMTLATANAGTTGNVCTSNIYGLNLGSVEPHFGSLNPACDTAEQEIASAGSYFFQSTRTAVGYEYDSYWGRPLTYWDAAAVTCGGQIAVNNTLCAQNGFAPGTTGSGAFFNALGNDATAAVYASQYWGCCNTLGQFNVVLEWARHLGSDPFTSAAWAGANSYQAVFTYASKGNLYDTTPNPITPAGGTANSNVVQAFFEQSGLGAGASGWLASGSTIPENNLTISGSAGLQIYGLQLDHWLSNQYRVGITAMHVQNIPGVTLPAGNPSTCPGCYVNSVNINQIYLDTWGYFL